MYTNHLYLKCESEKNLPNFYCFVCNRSLTKRAKPLKHLEACINKKMELPVTIVSPPPKRLLCVFCDETFDSLIEFEKHIWSHAKK